jgi:hypothetical protein
MLTKPIHGWSDFQLDGTSIYGLSYLDDIAFEWIAQAIHGLETMMPFCVKGFLEPNRFLCTVSYWNCHIVCEDDERYPLDEEDVINETTIFYKGIYFRLPLEKWRQQLRKGEIINLEGCVKDISGLGEK